MRDPALLKDPEYAITPEGFTAIYRDLLASERQTWPARSWSPYNLGHPCDRYLVWRWTKWDQQAAIEPEKLAVFREGDLHQPDVYNRLEKMGFRIIREAEKSVQWEPRKGVLISGRIDGKITHFMGEKFDPSLILEIKTTSPYTFDALKTIQDVRTHRAYYVRGYYDQDQLYCVLEERPRGVMIFKNKQTGMLKAIPFEIDYDRAEWLIARAERLTPMVRDKVDPPPIEFDPMICGDCAFEHLCFPPKSGGAGLSVLEDAELLTMLEERQKLKESSDSYGELDRAVKAKIKAAIGKSGEAILGPWKITVKTFGKKEYLVPAQDNTTVTLKRVE
jgi:CRISPR/Cas system-associated exonuclease Cas4 (RecB family)